MAEGVFMLNRIILPTMIAFFSMLSIGAAQADHHGMKKDIVDIAAYSADSGH
jgi:hypothetical protein